MSPPGAWIPRMDTESLKSGFSEISNRSRRTPAGGPGLIVGVGGSNGLSAVNINSSTVATTTISTPATTPLGGNNTNPNGGLSNHIGNHHNNSGGGTGNSVSLSLPSRHHHRSHHHNNHRSHRSGRSSRREEPLLETPESGHGSEIEISMEQMSPNTVGENHHNLHHRSGGGRDGHEVIEVQILPQQDDGWGDTATAVTGNTSDRSNSPVGNNTAGSIKWATMPPNQDPVVSLSWFQRYIGSVVGAGIVAVAALSPVLMVVGHRVGFPSSRPITNVRECGPECHAFLLTLSIKLIALFGAIWAIFLRGSPATMPRIFFFRAITLLFAFLAAFTFWLFYWVRAEEDGDLSLVGATAFAGGLADGLLAIHYLGVLLTEIRHISPQFQVTAVRSPDGVSKQWIIGGLSIQRAAVWILQHYYAEFPAYNPHLDRLPPLRKRHGSINNSNATSFKFYDFEGIPSSFTPAGRMSSRRGGMSHNERFYEEHEFERRVRKRKARLITAAEEAFTHIKRLQDEQGPAVPLDAMEAAAAVFPSLAKPLQKYLRATRQQPWHTAESVLNHLATCLRLGLAPRAFLDRYLSYQPVLQANREGSVVSWALVSDISVSRTISNDVGFLLRNGDVSLYVTVTALPHINLTEQVVDPKHNKFTLRLNSETSV